MGNSVSVVGNLVAAAILLSADLMTSCISWFAQTLAGTVDRICGSGQNTARRKVAWHEQRCSTSPVYRSESTWGELDVDATLKASTFPIKADALIVKARELMESEYGTANGLDGSSLAEDFQFVAPIVGPLDKKEFIKAFSSFKIKDAIPDIKDNSWFQVDPLEPNRVWWFSRTTGTHTGVLNFGSAYPPTGRSISMPPQAQSMLFNEEGKCYTITVGYCMDKRIGNTEGLGGVFGILKAVGKSLPFPEGKALYNPSLRIDGFEHIAKAAEGMGFDPVAKGKDQQDVTTKKA